MNDVEKRRKRLPVHPSVTLSRVMGAVELYNRTTDNPGICLACGADADGCEPDARRCECDECGENRVYGAQELLMMGVGHPG